jgi:hypothetical protein
VEKKTEGVTRDLARSYWRPKKVILGSVRRAGRDIVAGVYMVFAGVCWCLLALLVCCFVSTKMESMSAVPFMGTFFCIPPRRYKINDALCISV